MNSIIKKYNNISPIVKASFWFLMCSFIQKGINIITTPIFTRLLTTAEYGKFNVFLSWEYILNIFVSLCLSAGVYQQGLVKYETDYKRFSSSMQGLTLFLVSLWAILYLIFRDLINKAIGFNTIYMFSMLIIIWTNNVFAFWSNEQKTKFKYRKLIIITILISVLTPLISIVFIKSFNDKVYARIFAMVLVALLFYIALFISQVKRGKVLFDKKYWKYAIMYNLPLVPHYLSQTILSNSDRIMIEKMVDSNTAGIYSLAYSIALIMTLFNTSLMQTISPWMYKKIKNKETNQLKKVAYFSLIIIAIANIILIAFAPEAVYLFAPKEYYQAIYVIPPVAMSVYFMYTYDLFAKFEFYYEKTKMIATATVIGAILNLVLNYIFIRKYGFIAAAYTTLICYILYSVFHYIAMKLVCKEHLNNDNPYNLKLLIGISAVFMILGFAFMLLYNNYIIRYLFILLIIAIIVLFRKSIYNNLKLILKEKNN